MAEDRSEAMECRVVGRLGCEPEASKTLAGVPVCRLVVIKEAAGPFSDPVRVGLYLKGDLAERARRGLHEGDLIRAVGELGGRKPGSKHPPRYPEILVEDDPKNVKLWERAGVAA